MLYNIFPHYFINGMIIGEKFIDPEITMKITNKMHYID